MISIVNIWRNTDSVVNKGQRPLFAIESPVVSDWCNLLDRGGSWVPSGTRIFPSLYFSMYLVFVQTSNCPYSAEYQMALSDYCIYYYFWETQLFD